jgi:hypothetical protein
MNWGTFTLALNRHLRQPFNSLRGERDPVHVIRGLGLLRLQNQGPT